MHAASATLQFVRNAIFTTLHGPAGACIPVASACLIHVLPIPHVLKHCGAHTHTHIYIYTHKIKILGHPSWQTCQQGLKNNILQGNTIKMRHSLA